MPRGVYERKPREENVVDVPTVQIEEQPTMEGQDIKKVPAKCEWCNTIVHDMIPVFCSPQCQDAYVARH